MFLQVCRYLIYNTVQVFPNGIVHLPDVIDQESVHLTFWSLLTFPVKLAFFNNTNC